MYQWSAYVRDGARCRIGGALRAYLFYLSERANAAGACWPSVGTIARDMHRTRRAVQLALRTLADADELIIIDGGGWKLPNVYVLRGGRDPAECERIGADLIARLRGRGATGCAPSLARSAGEGRNPVHKGAQSATERGAVHCAGGAQSAAPEPNREPAAETPLEPTAPRRGVSPASQAENDASKQTRLDRDELIAAELEAVYARNPQARTNPHYAAIELLLAAGCDDSFALEMTRYPPELIARGIVELREQGGAIRNAGGWLRVWLNRNRRGRAAGRTRREPA